MTEEQDQYETEKCDTIAQTMEENKQKLFRYGIYRIGSKTKTEDVMQDLFLRLCKASGLPKDREELKCYIFRAFQNACTDTLRHHKQIEFQEIEALSGLRAEELAPQSFEQEMRLINRLMQSLPQEQSETIRLRIYSECSFQEIAQIMEVPITTAKSRFKYGIDKLRDGLALDNFLTF